MTDLPEATLRTPEDANEFRQVEGLIRDHGGGAGASAGFLESLSRNGNLVLAAFVGHECVGALIGYLGTDDESPGTVAQARLKHCAAALAVQPARRNQGIGTRLMLALRSFSLSQGIRLVTWGQDMLDGRLAHLAIRRLGGVSRSVVVNHLSPGALLQVEWWVSSARVRARAEGSRRSLDLANLLDAGVPKFSGAELRPDGLPQPLGAASRFEGNMGLVETPFDFAALAAKEPQLAEAWREHLIDAMRAAFDRGYLVTDFLSLSGERYPRAYYLLTYGEGTLG